jgi:hypothetical protein
MGNLVGNLGNSIVNNSTVDYCGFRSTPSLADDYTELYSASWHFPSNSTFEMYQLLYSPRAVDGEHRINRGI